MANSKINVQFPFEIKEADEEIVKKYPDIKNSSVFVGPKKYCLALPFCKDIASELYNFEAHPDDVWILGLPRSGTTLTSEIVWLLCNNLDYEKASGTIMDLRFPVLELATYYRLMISETTKEEKNRKIAEELQKPVWETFKEKKDRRFIKTHLPPSLAPPTILTSGCKVIYVARNPKDFCVSYFLYMASHKNFSPDIDFDKFWSYFHHGLSPYTPYFEHVKEGWELSKSGNVLFLFYESYSKDIKGTIGTIAEFLEKEISEEDMDILEQHLKIDNFRKNKSVNNDHLRELGVLKDESNTFIRKGVVGESDKYFQGRIGREADKWIKDNLQDTDLKFE